MAESFATTAWEGYCTSTPGPRDRVDGRSVTAHLEQDRRWVSFMHSHPNSIPLSASEVDRIAATVEPVAFDRIYGAWWDRNVSEDAKHAVSRSAERYRRALGL